MATAIQSNKKLVELDPAFIQQTAQTQEWKDLVSEAEEFEKNKKVKRVFSAKALHSSKF